MSQNLTAGFDIVLQLSEAEVNRQIAILFALGAIGGQINAPISVGGVSGTFSLIFNTPTLDLDSNLQAGVRINLPFVNSQLQVTAPAQATISPLSGTILIEDSAEMQTVGGTQQAIVNFANGIASVTFTFSAASQTLLTPLLAPLGITVVQLQNTAASAVQTVFTNQVLNFPLSAQIPVSPTNTNCAAITIGGNINGFVVDTINDLTAADRDALIFGIRCSATTGGNINLITASSIPPGGNAIMMLNNVWLLFCLMRPAIANALNQPASVFDSPLELNRSIDREGVTIHTMRGVVTGNRISITGDVSKDGTGWKASGTFQFSVLLSLQGGSITATTTEPFVSVEIDLDWWLYLVGFVAGGIVYGPIGAVVGAIVVAVADAVADGIADLVITDIGVGSVLPTIPTIPLGPIGAGVNFTSLELDDLVLGGQLLYTEEMPTRSSGYRLVQSGTAIDLDTGEMAYGITPGEIPPSGIDLVWSYQTGSLAFSPGPGAGMSMAGGSYYGLSQPDLEKFDYELDAIPYLGIPVRTGAGGLVMLAFAVRTNEGYYAKCATWRTQAGVHLMYVTYDRPAPALGIRIDWEIIDEKVIESGTDTWFDYSLENFPEFELGGVLYPGGVRVVDKVERQADYEILEVAYRGTFVAQPRLLAFPIEYQWRLCDTDLDRPKGNISAGTSRVKYELDGRQLLIETKRGADFYCELCVGGIDYYGREYTSCVQLAMPGTIRRGGRPGSVVQNEREALERLAAQINQEPGLLGPGGPQPDPVPFFDPRNEYLIAVRRGME